MKLQSYVVGTQRGYAYGLCTAQGVRFIECLTHDQQGKHGSSYKQASLNAHGLEETWKRRPDIIRRRDGFVPGGMPGKLWQE